MINQTKSGRDVWFPLQIYITSVSMILFAAIYSTFFHETRISLPVDPGDEWNMISF